MCELTPRIRFTDDLMENGVLKIPNSFSPIVSMNKLSKVDLINLTKSVNRQKNLKAYMKKMRLARRNSMEKSRKQRREDLDAEARNKLKVILTEFLECRSNGADGLSREIAIFKPKHLRLADIDREGSFSETSSISGGSISGSSRPRRSLVAPERFQINKLTPKPKVTKKPVYVDPDASYEVEAICDMNLFKNQILFQVKWQNYSNKDNTWEPLENVRECEAFESFLNYEMKGEEDALRAAYQQMLEDQEMEIETYKKKSKRVIMQELKQFDPIEFKCYQLIYNIVKDDVSFYQSLRKKIRHLAILNYFHELDVAQHEVHKEIKMDIMKKEMMAFSVAIVNDADFTTLEYFNYVRNNIFPIDLKPNEESMTQGCNCDDGCSRESTCCPTTIKGAQFGYKKMNGKKRLRLNNTQMIYECNENCSCGDDCLNRVTQQTRLFPMQIFKTGDGRGWGLKTLANIPKGSFLMEYTGEIIDQEESFRRGEKYDEIGQSYLFDFDFNDNVEAVYTVDAFKSGNLSRLINHSCEPNCRIWPVTTCNQDPLIYKLCYFSSRSIKADEELTFDYNGGIPIQVNKDDNEEKDEGVAGNNIVRRHRTVDSCKCGSEKCRGFIFN